MANKLSLLLTTLALIACFLLGFTIAQTIKQYYYPQTVTVESLQLETYLEEELLPNGTLIEWGTVEPDATYYYENFTVRNTGSVTCRVYLHIPDLPVGWTQTWMGNGTVLAPTQQVEATLNLTIPAGADGTYDWNSYIQGEQT